MIKHYEISLPNYPRGFHIITDTILKSIESLPENGLLNIFIKHSSAGLTINENADPSVRVDFENTFNKLIPENSPWFTHIFEGNDDMPAHIKSSLVSSSVMIPIRNNKLELGIWQGIYLCEFRNFGGRRNLILTVFE